MEQNVYLLLDSAGKAVARGEVKGKPAGRLWQIEVEDGKIDEVLRQKSLKLLSMMDAGPSYEGTIVRSRNDMIQLEVTRLEEDAGDMRKNLRVLVSFKSLIYPLTGAWKGRRPIVSRDLSCGGVAFFTDHSLRVGERLEIVIPVTSQPLVVCCQVLRIRPEQASVPLMYAAKFVDMCHDEEIMLREAVFNLQLRGRAKPAEHYA